MTVFHTLVSSLLAFVLFAASEVRAEDEVMTRALSDELARSMTELAVEDLDRPYFISYRVDEIRAQSAVASFGSLLSSRERHSRVLSVEVRVGSYRFDNTNFLSLQSISGGGAARASTLPLDDDYQEIRRQVWLATDRAFKAALENLAQKRSLLQNKTLAEELDDFFPSEPVEMAVVESVPETSQAQLEALVGKLSAIFRSQPGVFESRVGVMAASTDSLYINSEGSQTRRVSSEVRLVARAANQAEDGQPLEDVLLVVKERFDELPSLEELKAEVADLGERLTAHRAAELLDRYNGPVLFKGQAAAEIFVQGFVPHLVGQRDPLVANERLESVLERGKGKAFRDRIGARVLPRFMAVSDDPQATEHEGQRLLGGFAVDDQGSPASFTKLIERGYLKTLLSGRTPVSGVDGPTGNSRGGGVAPSNLVVEATTTLDDEALLEELLLLVEDRGAEFGVVIERLRTASAGGRGSEPLSLLSTASTSEPPAIVAMKIYPDGRTVPLRNLEISNLSPAIFKDIIAAGDSSETYNLPLRPLSADPLALARTGASFGGVSSATTIGVVIPSLLFEEVTLRKPTAEIPSLPVAPHPAFSPTAEP